jgi:hypothetical protein
MFQRLGLVGVLGVVVMVAGIGLVTWQNPIIGGGIALMLAGVGLVVRSLVTSMLSMFGMA